MTPRLNVFHAAPEGAKAMMEVEKSLQNSGLEASLQDLVRLRASQINGCAFCIHMHVTEALTHGEDALRLQLLDGWRDSPLYTDRERAALAWTESLTLVADTRAPDEAYEGLDPHFTDEEKVSLTFLITTINGWNRISVGLRAIHPVEPAKREAA